jgi:hypothetical protein
LQEAVMRMNALSKRELFPSEMARRISIMAGSELSLIEAAWAIAKAVG